MHLEDRIELSNKVFNVYTAYSILHKVIHSVLYVEDSEKCKVVKFISEPVTTKEIDMKLSSLHNKMLAKLFNALRKNPTNPENELLENDRHKNEPLKETENSHDNETHEKTIQTYEQKKDFKSPTEPYWNEFCQENLPNFAKYAFFIDQSGISTYGRDEIQDNLLNDIISINKYLIENAEKIHSLIGVYRNVVLSTDKELYFFYPVSNEDILVIITTKGALGLYIKELNNFRKLLVGTLHSSNEKLG